jgi:nucleoid DNA-binding protein
MSRLTLDLKNLSHKARVEACVPQHVALAVLRAAMKHVQAALIRGQSVNLDGVGKIHVRFSAPYTPARQANPVRPRKTPRDPGYMIVRDPRLRLTMAKELKAGLAKLGGTW